MAPVVHTSGLRKEYGRTVALKGVDLRIGSGEAVALVGPNGAGKTTLVEILEGLRAPTAGKVSVFGIDPRRDPERIRERIGVQLQATSLPRKLTVAETLALFGSFYPEARPVGQVLARMGLDEVAGQRTETLSGGQQQRLTLGMALIHDPEFVILDEPTTGLDPEGRRDLHDYLLGLRGEGRTILLTTHYIEEAEKLCGRVLMLRAGEIVADGSPLELMRRARGRTILWLAVEGELDPTPLLEAGAEADGRRGEYHRFTAPDAATALRALHPVLAGQDLTLQDLRLKRPTLEDVYLELMSEDGGVAPSPPGRGAAGGSLEPTSEPSGEERP